MLDIARRETSLDIKRRELAEKISEGRTVIATLMERHATLGDKIDIATAALKRIEQQLQALDTVRGLFGDDEIMFETQPIWPPAAPGLAPHVQLVPQPEPEPEAFKPLTYMRCLVEGHDMKISRSVSGRVTCRKCRMRRKF